MRRDELTEKILDIKREKGWKWSHICDQIGGMSPVMIVGAILGQMKLTKPQAANAGELFGLSTAETAMLNEVPMRGEGTVVRGDILSLPLPDASVDLAYCWEVLHHLSDPEAAIREMARVSRRFVVIVEPNRANPLQFAFGVIDRHHRWQLKFSLAYLRRLMRASGLDVAHASSGGFILPNRTPRPLLGLLRKLPYSSAIGISNWVIGVKA